MWRVYLKRFWSLRTGSLGQIVTRARHTIQKHKEIESVGKNRKKAILTINYADLSF
jgi:hypothetical protein